MTPTYRLRLLECTFALAVAAASFVAGPAMAQKQGGTVTVGLELDIPGFDPLKVGVYDTAANIAAKLLYDTLTTLDERLRELWEPGAAGVEQRCRVIEEARRAGIETSVMFGPLLPFLSDSQEDIDALLKRAADLGVDVIWVDALNPRPRVWPAVACLLREKFPELMQSYRRILFDRPSRAAYLDELRNRIENAARRESLTDRVASCV